MPDKVTPKDGLRRRPNKIRYSYIVSSPTNVHTGFSYWGLEYVYKKHGINDLFVVDLLKKIVIHVKEPVENFMKRWRANYNNPKWDYEEDLKNGVEVPNIRM